MEQTLGKRIANYRKEKELKQENLASMLNVSPQAVSKWENDVTCPDISVLPELAKILGITVDELLVGKKDEKPLVSIVPEEKRKEIKDMMLKILVNSADGDKVKINLPLALIEAAVEMGMEMPEVSSNINLRNIDFAKILNLVKKGAVGNLLEVESSDGDTVCIFVE